MSSNAAQQDRASNAMLIARRAVAVPRGLAMGAPIFVGRAMNEQIWDVEGNRYIDFASGIGVLNTGHCHPHVMAAALAQLQRYTHTCFVAAPYEPYVALAEELNSLAPVAKPARTLLVTTGAEAVENAIKIARVATGRSDVVAFAGAFHGRTLLTLGLTGKTNPYKTGFAPFPAGLWHVPFPNHADDGSVDDCLAAFAHLFETEVPADRVAAILVEPVQGEGGFNIAPARFMQALRQLCDAKGILLIADEIQSGFGRTGRWFAIEHCGVQADIVTMAKGLGGGFPLAGVTGRSDVMDAAVPGSLGGTYAGNPVSCAAALAVIDVIRGEGLLEKARAQGERLFKRVTETQEAHQGLPMRRIRGLGAMIAFDVVDEGGEPNGALAKKITNRCRENGLLILTAGSQGQTIRLLVPLTANEAVVEEGLAILERSLLESV